MARQKYQLHPVQASLYLGGKDTWETGEYEGRERDERTDMEDVRHPPFDMHIVSSATDPAAMGGVGGGGGGHRGGGECEEKNAQAQSRAPARLRMHAGGMEGGGVGGETSETGVQHRAREGDESEMAMLARIRGIAQAILGSDDTQVALSGQHTMREEEEDAEGLIKAKTLIEEEETTQIMSQDPDARKDRMDASGNDAALCAVLAAEGQSNEGGSPRLSVQDWLLLPPRQRVRRAFDC
jgi:hypothetical protein